MELNLRDQKIAIFGGAKGIGRAITESFLSEGCIVRIFDRERFTGKDHEQLTSTLGDATSKESVQAFTKENADANHLVFCIGIGSGKSGFPFWNLDPSDWHRVLEVNLIAAVNAAHSFAPLMAERGAGSMTFLTSVAGQIGSQTDPPYSAAKAGLINFVQCAAKDLGPHGVRVNAISPGMVQTDLNQSVWAAGQKQLPDSEKQDYTTWAEEKIRKISPLGRWQQAEEIAAMATYLASHLARNITGQTLNIDGGQVMHS